MKGFLICNRINEDNTSGAFIIGLGDGFKALLSSSIPNLHFDFDAVDVDSFDFEVDAYGGDVGHFIFLIDVTEEYIGFANSSVADNNKFD